MVFQRTGLLKALSIGLLGYNPIVGQGIFVHEINCPFRSIAVIFRWIVKLLVGVHTKSGILLHMKDAHNDTSFTHRNLDLIE